MVVSDRRLVILNQDFDIDGKEVQVTGLEHSFPFLSSAKGQRGTRTLLRRKTVSPQSIRQSVNSRLSYIFLKKA